MLCWLLGDDFVRVLDEYLQPGFHKGIPPLFVNLKGLYVDPFKVQKNDTVFMQIFEDCKFRE